MTPEILTMLGMTTAILFTLWQMNNSLRLEIRDEFKSVRDEIKSVRDEIKAVDDKIDGLRTEMGKLDSRMSRGLIDGLREAIAAIASRSAA